MMGVVIVTLVLAALLAVGFAYVARRAGCYPWGPAAKEPQGEKYGHPWSPVDELRKVLPKPPDSSAWEISVDANDRGYYLMRLGLVSLITGTSKYSDPVNLTMYTSHGNKTWETWYSEYKLIRRQQFNVELIFPLKSWADRQLALQRGPGNVEYHLEAGS